MGSQYYLTLGDGSRLGPMDSTSLRRRVQEGTATRETLVWCDRYPDWVALEQVLKPWPEREPPPPPAHLVQTRANGLTDADRESVLEALIQHWSGRGYRITSRTVTTAQMVKPKQFEAALAIVLLLLFVLPFFLYLLIYLAESDKTIYLAVAPDGVGTFSEKGRTHRMTSSGEVEWENAPQIEMWKVLAVIGAVMIAALVLLKAGGAFDTP